VNYVDRVTLSVANPTIARDLHLSPSQMGVLLSAFLWPYLLAQGPAGVLIDRLGPRRLLGAAMALWSLAQVAAGFVISLPQFVAARVLLGLGEAPQFPVGARVVRTAFAPKDRGLATGVFNSASTLGPAIGPPLVTALILWTSWRGAFIATGLAGFAVLALWLAAFRDPNPRSPEAQTRPISGVLGSPTLWAMAAGNFGSGYMNWFYATWLPGYLQTERHLSLTSTGWAAGAPYLFGFLGSLVGGWACDRLAERGLAPIVSRKVPIVVGLAAGAAFTGLTNLAPNAGLAVATIAAAIFFANLAGTSIWALAVAVAPREAVATVGGLQNAGGLLGGAVAPIVTGVLLEATHSFSGAVAITAAIASAAAIVYLAFVRRPIMDAGEQP
jgi:MFS family permease